MRGPYQKMAGSSRPFSVAAIKESISVRVIISYVLDWIVLIAFGLIAMAIGMITPNKRPFSLNDPNISFPFTEHEAVPTWLLMVICAAIPVVLIFVITIIFVPGATVPANTPKTLIWKRKLWELHVGLLGLALAHVLAFFFTQGMKNMFGKPRPDLLARCNPDVANASDHVVGGFAGENVLGLLYSASICRSTDDDELDDGFRSYPSGHASSSAAGLVYLSLFLASKFAVTIPFAVANSANASAASRAAFPSRALSTNASDAPLQPENEWEGQSLNSGPSPIKTRNAEHNAKISSVRRQAAAPPLYLLALTLIPFGTSIFIAASRWWDFRHHGFDILFGWLMGLITSVYAFRYYHLSISEGAGWAWGPRTKERAFWAGVGRVGYAGDAMVVPKESHPRKRAVISNDNDYQSQTHAHTAQPTFPPPPGQANEPAPGYMTQRQNHGAFGHENYSRPQPSNTYGGGSYDDVEMQRMDSRF